MPVVTLVYALTNFALFVVLTKEQIITSGAAVAVTFGDQILGMFSWIMPLFVALCTFGSLNGAIYASSRLFFVGARNGHLPLAIALIDVRRLTPVPSLIFMVSAYYYCHEIYGEIASRADRVKRRKETFIRRLRIDRKNSSRQASSRRNKIQKLNIKLEKLRLIACQ